MRSIAISESIYRTYFCKFVCVSVCGYDMRSLRYVSKHTRHACISQRLHVQTSQNFLLGLYVTGNYTTVARFFTRKLYSLWSHVFTQWTVIARIYDA